MSNGKNRSVVTTSSIVPENMSAEEQAKLFEALAARFAGTPLALSIEKTMHESNVTVVSQRVKKIDSLITELRAEINTRNEKIKTLLSEKSSLGIKGAEKGTRTVNTCTECGQGRHADNDKTRACQTYATAQAAKAAEKKQDVAVAA